MRRSQRLLSAAALGLVAFGVSTQAFASKTFTARITSVRAYSGEYVTFAEFEGLSDLETESNGAPGDGTVSNTSAGAYACDRLNATLDLPFVDMQAVNAEATVQVLLSASLSGRQVQASWGDDCRITYARMITP